MATYTVKKGDTLSAIGKKYGVSYQDIAKENGISNPNVIYAGQTLNITTPQDNVAPKTNPPTGANANNNGKTGGNNSANGGATGGNTFTTPAGNTYDKFTYDDFTYDPFQASDLSNQAWATLGQLQGNAPGDWVDPYKDKYMGYLSQYENRDPFSYDFNNDALYQQYKDQYVQQGQMAMMDTMGQAAAMTGGYGNSYAQTVGQQVYNQYLGQLNTIMPELYDRAYGIYQQEGQELLDMYNAYLGLSESDYNHYLGSVDNYYKQLGAATDYATALHDKEYGEWLDDTKMKFDTWSANTGLDFDTWAAETGILSDENNTLMNQEFQREENDKDRAASEKANAKSDLINLITSTGYKPTDSELAAAGITRNQADGYAKAYSDSIVSSGNNYAKFDSDTQDKWAKKFQGATSLPEIEAIADDMEAAGIDPKYVGQWATRYAEKFKKDSGDNFTGTTYAEATAYLKSIGVSGDYIAGVMTDREWAGHKSGYSTYGDYLKAYVKDALRKSQ